MKKIISIFISILLLSSCVSYNQENINLSLSITKKYSDFGDNKSIFLTIDDARQNTNYLGNKRLGENLINIKNNNNLLDIIKNKISRDLEQNGFLTSDSNLTNSVDKTLEIKILTLNYEAYREFFVGSSKIDILLKITAKDRNKNSMYSTTQNFSLNKNHFIMPLITTDEKTINNALQGALDDITTNQKLLDFLKN